ncbi:MAG TPA: hypothetical protein VIB39_02395 [Candidatus Angelobacter sp.]|jgi:hypothetical protein
MPTVKTAREKSSPATKQAATPDFASVFAVLRQMLEEFVGEELTVQTDKPGNYHIEIPSILHRRKPLYFAGVRTGKNYVSFYLMSAYYSPELVKSMSPALKKRKQGKACFNFTAVDPDCFAELQRLAADGLKKFRSAEFRQMIQKMQ